MGETLVARPHGRSFREQLYRQLEAPSNERLTPLNKVVILIIAASVGLGIASTESTVQDALGDSLPFIELMMGLIFIVEFLARLWSAGVDSKYAGFRGALRYLKRPLSVVDVLVVVSLLAPSFGAEFAVLRLLRILRLVALAKFGRYSQALQLLGEAFSRRRYELVMSVALAGLIILISATGMYAIEGAVQAEAFGSIPRALWWSLMTLTTVGYGDVYPITPIGRIFAGVAAVAGIGLIAMPTGILASAFTEIGSGVHAKYTDIKEE